MFRFELEPHGASREERERAFRKMFHDFKRAVNDSGILTEWKQKQYFESQSQKRRRKRKQAEIERQKEKLREYFGTRQK